jgi:hypothetical protein
MKVVAYERLGGKTYVFEAAQVVLYDKFDNPIAIAADYGMPGQQCHYVSKVTDEDFNRTLQALGIDKLVVCHDLQGQSPLKGSVLAASP